MFARARVRWPLLIRRIFTIMSAFNLNLELAAPECLLEVSYTLKWFASEALPLAACFVFFLVFVVQ